MAAARRENMESEGQSLEETSNWQIVTGSAEVLAAKQAGLHYSARIHRVARTRHLSPICKALLGRGQQRMIEKAGQGCVLCAPRHD